MLSHSTGYAIGALSRLETAAGEWMLCKDIAGDIGAPQPYLSKILHRLRQSGLVVAKRGYRGGFALARPATEISLLEIAQAVEGDGWLPTCMLGLPECCESGTCPTHAFWQIERERIEDKLQYTSLADVTACSRAGAMPIVCVPARAEPESETVMQEKS
jgi:Rrf2 family iron-sulfur cluster assembly transcriptional regulator